MRERSDDGEGRHFGGQTVPESDEPSAKMKVTADVFMVARDARRAATGEVLVSPVPGRGTVRNNTHPTSNGER